MYDITIIGAGVVGALIARRLAAYDLKICLLDQENDVGRGATAANSAIVHAGFDAREGSLKARMNVRGAELMPAICEELGVSYRRNGSLVVAFADEREAVEAIYRRGVANGVPGLRILEREELMAMEPHLNPDLACALYAPTGAIVCPYGLTIAAVGNAMDNGAELLLNFAVTGVERDGEAFTVRAADGRAVHTRYLVNSAGLHADDIARMTAPLTGDEVAFAIHPRRGEYMLMDKTCGDTVGCTVFHTPTAMGKGVLVTPTVHGNLLVGPTATDITDKDDTSTTAEGFADIRRKAGDNVADIPYGKVITSFCGLRAVGDAGDFIIHAEEGVVTLGGIESPGLSSSPAIAEYVETLLVGMGLTITPKAGYRPRRAPMDAFRHMTPEEKNAVIAADDRYGRIICRCEEITEGEIVAAIHRNPPAYDLDAVKRRTRSGMGRCQGGFCLPEVVRILAREWGVSLDDVTKNGGDSYIIRGRTKTAGGRQSTEGEDRT